MQPTTKGLVGVKKTTFALLHVLSLTCALTLPSGYDSSLRPNSDGVADVVNVSMQILSIRGIDENVHEISLDVMLHAFWVDPRLSALVERETMFVSTSPHIWLPDLFIVNSVQSQIREKSIRSLRLQPDGSVAFSERLSARVSCPMSFVKFPFDKQSCKVNINSYGYSNVHLLLVWNGMVNENVDVFDPEYKLSYTEQHATKSRSSMGEFTNLILEIHLHRCGTRFLRRAMIPAVFLGLLSYYTFFLKIKREDEDSEEVQHGIPCPLSVVRMALNGLMLALIVFIAQINYTTAPPSAAITGLDVWMAFLTFTVFLAFFQSIHGYFLQCKYLLSHDDKGEAESVINRVDRWLIIAIPMLFILFVIIYFAAYLT